MWIVDLSNIKFNIILHCTDVPQPSVASIAGPSLVIVSIISCLPGVYLVFSNHSCICHPIFMKFLVFLRGSLDNAALVCRAALRVTVNHA